MDAAQAADEDAVARFVAVTGSSSDQAAFMLEATHGNFEQAVQMYLGRCSPAPLCCQQITVPFPLPTNHQAVTSVMTTCVS